VPLDKRLRDSIKSATLHNALEHDGKARADAVIGKIAAASEEFRANLKSIVPAIKEAVVEINSLSPDVQKLLLDQLEESVDTSQRARLTERSQVASSILLPMLDNATRGKVITRFPPEPSGYPHIGHAKAAIIDEFYARIYAGKFILRFDDTNPLNEKLEYYEAFIQALEWLNIHPDIIKNTSDDIELLYNYGRKLVLNGDAYVCFCNQDKIHSLRSKGVECECRKRSTSNISYIDNFFDGRFNQNEAIIRFKGSMTDQNTVMRDPTLFRVIRGYHPKLGDKYQTWPTYDFAAPIEDSLDGVSHAFRTKEYELRNTLYFAILERLGLRKPNMIEFSRLEFHGLPVSKRKIKPLIENNIIKSWDDPRLPTLAAMKRRGFIPEAIRKFVLSLGMTLAETKPPFESLEAFNRKLIEPESIRLFFVKDPVEILIQNSTGREIGLKNHPNIDLGTRRVKVGDSIYISKDDAIRLRAGNEIRLIELYNIRVVEIKSDGTKLNIVASWSGDNVRPDIPKIQWVAKNDDRPFEILVPKELYHGDTYNVNSLEVWKGLGESFVTHLKPDSKVQFVRMGFCRIEGSDSAVFTHK
jgi:glutamyl-tRNA synthetase